MRDAWLDDSSTIVVSYDRVISRGGCSESADRISEVYVCCIFVGEVTDGFLWVRLGPYLILLYVVV